MQSTSPVPAGRSCLWTVGVFAVISGYRWREAQAG